MKNCNGLCLYNQRINLDDFSVFSDIPKMLTQDSLSKLLQVLNELKVCPGNPDDKFVEVVRAKKGGMKRKDGELACFVDDYAPVHLNGDVYETTIRPSNCGMLVNAIASRCEEMKVKENLIYNKFTGEIVGFTSLGSVNDELQQLDTACTLENKHPQLASHLLVLMVRGIFFKLNFPYAHFGSTDISGDILFPIMWEAIRQIEGLGLKVISIVGDGASPNRKFFRMHSSSQSTELVYKTLNVYAPEKRWIYLMKTTRNCLANSGVHGTRHMEVSF